jgi:CubicO group peptidase (beta-lactamase class C family)
MRKDTVTQWLCCTKSLVAILIAQLEEEGRLDVEQPVVRYWPEFAANGKSHVTLRALLTHTSGMLGDPAEEYLFCSSERVAESIAQCRLDDSGYAGDRARYIHFSGWAALGEVIRRVTGASTALRLKQSLFEPLEMRDSHLGLPLSTFDAYGDRLSRLHIGIRGFPPECSFLNWREVAGYDWPGFAARGPAFELGRVFESLLGHGPAILGRAAVHRFTSPSRGRLYDDNLQDEVDWGLGFKTSSAFFGSRALAERAFGHTGLGSSFCLALPDLDLVVVWVSNVISPPPVHRARIRRLTGALLACLQPEEALA